jgi:hypothetical protein
MLVQKGQATTIYIAKEEYRRYQDLVKAKLGKKAGPRIVELIRQDAASLEGKPVIDNNESINELQARLEVLTKKRDDLIKILNQHNVFKGLKATAVNDFGLDLSFESTDKAKLTIAKMIKAFNDGKIDETQGDFQLFLGLIETGIERHKVLNRLAELRTEKYCDPTMQPQQPAANKPTEPTESTENKQAAEEETEEENKDNEGEDEEE